MTMGSATACAAHSPRRGAAIWRVTPVAERAGTDAAGNTAWQPPRRSRRHAWPDSAARRQLVRGGAFFFRKEYSK